MPIHEQNSNLSLFQRLNSSSLPTYLVVAVFVIGLTLCLYPIYVHQKLFGVDLSQFPTDLSRVLAFLGILITLLLFWCVIQFFEVRRRRDFEKWAIGVMGSMAARLMKLDKDIESESVDTQAKTPVDAQTSWPWGSHHTILLGHLDAAARRFWLLYDPADRTTAPTNEMVADWLQSERGVSKDKARAIASMLRADGLPMGPRT